MQPRNDPTTQAHHATARPSARPALASLLAVVIVLGASTLAGLWLGGVIRSPSTAIEPTATPVPTLPAADVAGADVTDLPRYPGAVRASYRRETLEGLTVTVVTYAAEAEVDEVRSFYRRVFREYGWELVELDVTAGEWVFLVTAAGRVALIEIEPGEPFTSVEIELEEPAPDGGVLVTPAPTVAPPAPPPPPPGDDDDGDD